MRLRQKGSLVATVWGDRKKCLFPLNHPTSQVKRCVNIDRTFSRHNSDCPKAVADYSIHTTLQPQNLQVDQRASESDTGYTEHVQLYFGRRNRQQPHPHGVGYSVVTELVEPHYNKFHHVTTDRLFTSPKLTHDLLGNGTYSTGTVIAGRKGMPLSLKR
ncbi:unnamed protein product [Mytilus edulis]|uniref:PiggyBac transposable element-derived protein domain-containing protein n=1 Tax=Mytilus edulis TaxID=6550 RepID=A0A8S3TP77_MYTED|nr:unnamed protein product [Mytilus edulis]